MLKFRMAVLLTMLAALLAAACGEAPTESGAEPPTDSAGSATASAAATSTEDGATEASPAEGGGCDPSAYDDVIAEVEGLDADARWARLMELAAEEEGQFQVYGTISGDEIGPLMEDFLEVTADAGIDATHYLSLIHI